VSIDAPPVVVPREQPIAILDSAGQLQHITTREEILRDTAVRLFPGETKAAFERLASLWRREALPTSSAAAMAAHPAYQQIIKMGMAVVPFILEELRREPAHWFIALRRITGAQPVAPGARGQIQKMTDAWIRWGFENHFLNR